MEEILGKTRRAPIVLSEFLNSYKAKFKHPFKMPVNEIDVKEAMGLKYGTEFYDNIKANVMLSHLQSSDDTRVSEYIPGNAELRRKAISELPADALNLKSLRELLAFKENTQRNPFQRTPHTYTLIERPNVENELLDYEPGNELKICIRIYRPARVTHRLRTLERPVFAQEFECLGSNFLTELRDKIQCICNNKRFFDISEDPESKLPGKTTDPGYFFITDTFYNDNRNSQNADYSATVRDWAKTAKGLEHVKFNVASMEATRFIDLTVSLGFPQQYLHHGNCEHVFTFSQIEIVTTPSKQMLPRSHYPRLIAHNYYNNKLCNTCGHLQYVYVVQGSNRLVHDPAYLCKKCFLSYNYVDGKKIGEFRAYRVIDSGEFASNDLQQANTEAIQEQEEDAPLHSDDSHLVIIDDDFQDENDSN